MVEHPLSARRADLGHGIPSVLWTCVHGARGPAAPPPPPSLPTITTTNPSLPVRRPSLSRVQSCVELLKESSWNLADTVEGVLQRAAASATSPSPSPSPSASAAATGAAPGAPAAASDRPGSPYTYLFPKGSRSCTASPRRRSPSPARQRGSDPGTPATPRDTAGAQPRAGGGARWEGGPAPVRRHNNIVASSGIRPAGRCADALGTGKWLEATDM